MTLGSDLRAALESAISDAAGTFHLGRASSVSGGCIHRCFVVEDRKRRYFVKVNDRSHASGFAAEAAGLVALAEGGARVPSPLCHGEAGRSAYLVMEYLELRRGGDYAELGRMLAMLHARHGTSYGWTRDNFIGSTPQPNPWMASWSEFWREARLRPQLALAERNGLGSDLLRKGEKLAASLDRFLAGRNPAISLLHGDLWGGNAGFLADGQPVLFDPAVYYGDREADLAMTELFGGFPPEFYSAYSELSALDPGYDTRKSLYNLYHVLNHANLFGGGYTAQAASMMDRLLLAI